MDVDESFRVSAFVEKPADPAGMPGRPDHALASMGIYVFTTEFLYEELIKDADNPQSSHDFGKDIIPAVIGRNAIYAYPFRGTSPLEKPYWRDVGTVDSYFHANMEMIAVTPELNLYDKDWPIWTYQEQLPPAKFVFDEENRRGMAVDSMVSGGCIISGASVCHSLLFSNVRAEPFSTIVDSVILPGVTIGEHCRLKRTIIDKSCVIPPRTVIGEDLAEDRKRFYVSPQGVVLVTPEMLGQPIHHVR
jgi:glucose-1-phosphate adenylyltransferase